MRLLEVFAKILVLVVLQEAVVTIDRFDHFLCRNLKVLGKRFQSVELRHFAVIENDVELFAVIERCQARFVVNQCRPITACVHSIDDLVRQAHTRCAFVNETLACTLVNQNAPFNVFKADRNGEANVRQVNRARSGLHHEL